MRARFSQVIPLLLASAYLLVVWASMGLRTEHLLLIGFILGCYYLHPKSRRFILDFLPFVFFGLLYDFLRIYPKSWAGPIQVVWPWRLERSLFGSIPCDFFAAHHRLPVDILAGIAYSLHVVVPVGFAFVLWMRDHVLARRFIWAFLIANLFAFATYITLPVAPPWYVVNYGLTPANWSIPPSAAGLVRFDTWLGLPYFQGVYSRNAWTFGAIPSMHGGLPFLTLLFARKIFRKALIPLCFFTTAVWFSAVYLGHHYVIDLIAGVLYVLAAFRIAMAIPEKWIR